MRALLQRVSHASVHVGDELVGRIGPRLLVLLGVVRGDTPTDAARLAGRVARCRIFSDAAGKFKQSLLDVGGEALIVSQFTV